MGVLSNVAVIGFRISMKSRLDVEGQAWKVAVPAEVGNYWLFYGVQVTETVTSKIHNVCDITAGVLLFISFVYKIKYPYIRSVLVYKISTHVPLSKG